MNQGAIPTGCFGKLPAAADYIHHHRGGPGILEWQRWIQDGVGAASARFGSSVEALLRGLRVHGFAYPGVRSDAYLVGAFGPGHDRSGRVFPFSVFADVSPGPAGSVAELVLACENLLRRAAELVTTTDVDLPTLFAGVDQLGADDATAPARGPVVAAYLSHETVGALTSGSDGDASRSSLVRVTRNLGRVAAQVERDRRQPGYGLRFPLPADPGSATASRVAFIEMSLRMLGPKLRPALFWTQPGHEGILDLYPTPPGPSAFLHLLDRTLESDAVFAMDEGASPPEGMGAREDPAGSCWADAGLSLMEAVDRVAPANGRRRI